MSHLETLKAVASAYPETDEGTSCNRIAIKVRKKNFVFLGDKDDKLVLMVKLGPSLGEAEALAQDEPERYDVGSAGWVTVRYELDRELPKGLFERWIDESFRLLAPKSVVKQLEG